MRLLFGRRGQMPQRYATEINVTRGWAKDGNVLRTHLIQGRCDV